MCNDAVNRDSTFRVMSEDSASKSEEFQSSLSAVRTMYHPVRKTCHSVQTSDRQASYVRTTCFFRPDTYIVSRSFCASLLCPDVSAACPDAYQSSKRFTDSFQVQEREDQSTVRTMWFPVRTRISVRQESQFKMNRPDI